MTSTSGISDLTESEPKEAPGNPVHIQNISKATKSNAPSSNGSEITVKEFLDFLKTAYQVRIFKELSFFSCLFQYLISSVK